MRIGIDASRATAAEPAGTENYSLHLIRALVDLAAGRPDLELELYAKTVLSADMGDQNGYTTHVIPNGRGWTHLRLSAQMLRRRPDVLFVPAHVVPLIHPERTVVTIHDLGYLQYPEAHPTIDRWYLDLSTRWNARSSCRIITPSQATKIDVMNRLGVDGDLIEVIHSGVDPAIRPVGDGARIEEVKARHGITGEYLLTVGTVHPRKNIAGLLKAFDLLRREDRIGAKLVVVGKMGWKIGQFASLAQALGDQVVWAGYVPPEDLPALYSGATLFVLPSLSEGFGFPVLEAMACGTPVVASNTTSLPEIAGDAAVLVDPKSASDIARGMLSVAENGELRENMRRKGLDQASRFTWRATAEKTLAVLEDAGHRASPASLSAGAPGPAPESR